MADGSRSFSAQGSPAVWLRLTIPSVGDVIFIVLLARLVLSSLSVRLLGDAGIGWHIRTGQQILTTRAIPRADLFSSIMNGKPWFAWEWLYDVIAGGLERVLGLNGVVLFTALIISVVFAWTFRLLTLRGTNLLVAIVLVLLAAAASMIHFLARPHVVTWLFALAWFHILDSSERGAERSGVGTHSNPIPARRELSLWLLPGSMLLWVNLHGGFLIAFALVGIYWLSALWMRFGTAHDRLEDTLRKHRAAKRARQLALVTVLTALATLANPYGFRLHVHIYTYLSNRFLMDHIDEFQSPNFHGVAQKCFAILLLLAFLTAAAKVRNFTVSEILIVMFAVSSGLYASRNIPIASLLLVLVIGPTLSEAVERLGTRGSVALGVRRLFARFATFSARMGQVDSRLRGSLWSVVAVILICAIAANGGKLRSQQLMYAHFDDRRFPEAAVNFMERGGAHEPVLSPDSWGGYLIYRFYPKTQIVLDDRHDLYGEDILKSYLKMMAAEPGWGEFLRAYKVKLVLIPKASPLANILASTPEWKLEYADDVAVLFERDGG